MIFFGPAGAGKSVQGQMLAARMGWRWLSMGQLLRDSKDPEIHELLRNGQLVSNDQTHEILIDALQRAEGIDHLILDGFPRKLDQAQWLVNNQDKLNRKMRLAIILEVPREELVKRLELRGRVDDTPEIIDERLNLYRREIYPILNFMTEQSIPVAHIDGVGTIGQIHDRIARELADRGLINDVSKA